MDLYKIIPEKPNWIIQKNKVYIDHLAKIPILLKKDNDVHVYLDVRILKYVLKLVEILEKNKIEFLFRSNLIVFEHKFIEDDIHRINIKQYLTNYSNPKVYDGFHKINFNMTENLSKYILKFNCQDIFKEVYQREKKRILAKGYSSSWEYTFLLKREEIRDYIDSLDRDIKISLLI